MSIRTVMCAAALLLAAGAAARAESVSLVSWDLSGAPGDQPSTPGVGLVPGIAGKAMVRGAGLTPNAGANSFNAAGWTGQDTDYIEFGFSVASGLFVELDRLIIATRSSNTGPGTVGLFTSLDSFTTPVFTFTMTGTAFNNDKVDLSGLGRITGDFVVRLIQIGTNSAAGGTTQPGGTFRVAEFLDGPPIPANFLDVQFTGTLNVIPEPSSALLTGLGVAGLAGAIRLRRRGS